MRSRLFATTILLGLATVGAAAQDISTMSTEEVRALQQRLSDAGCYSGPLNGNASTALTNAIKACPSQDPVLRIETGMHSARITRISLDATCKKAVTVSEDKTVRYWSLPEGRLIRTQRMPIGDGDLGKSYAVAISPDGSLVAAGGTDAILKAGRQHGVYFFDTDSGSKIKHFVGFPHSIRHLVFSPDGTKLIVTLAAQGIRVLDVRNGTLLMSDRDYVGDSYAATFSRNGEIYATGDDGFIRFYGADLERKAKVPVPNQKRAFSLALDPTGQRLAVGYDDRAAVDIFDARTLRFIAAADVTGSRAEVRDDFSIVAWSPDGQFVYGGGRYRTQFDGVWKFALRKWDRMGKQQGPDLPTAENTILSMTTCAEAIAFAAYDPSFGVILPNDTVVTLGQRRIPEMRGKTSEGFLISPDGKRLRFGLSYGQVQPILFDLKSGTVEASPNTPLDLDPASITGLNITDWSNRLDPKLDGKPLKIQQFEQSSSIAIRPDRSGFLLGASFSLHAFNADGTSKWRIEVPGEVWGVNLARDGELAIAAYSDGTVRWHRWSDGKELLALFVHKDDRRWVAWTPIGYYMASPGAEDLIGWHLNRGWEQPADFFPVARFRDRFNRPDIVRLVLETLDEAEAIKRANTTSRRAEVPQQVISDLPPVIRVTNFNEGSLYRFTTNAQEVAYELRTPSGRPIERIEVKIDGRPHKIISLAMAPANTPATRSGKLTADDLPKRDIEVALIAWSGQQASEPARFRLNWGGPREDIKPKLFALIIGVSNYTDPSLKLQYASKDGTDIAAKLMEQKGLTYEDVQVNMLIDGPNKPVTRENIIDGLQWLEQQKTNSLDVSVIFLAGHGVSDERGTYYFLPSNVDIERLRSTGVRQEEIESTLRTLKNRVLLFLDTCHSGRAVRLESLRVDINPVVNRFSGTETGVIAFASSQGREDSIESADLKNGIFTKALLEGLFDFRADLMRRGRITPGQLFVYLDDRVQELSELKQKPVMVRPPTVPEYPIIAKN